MKEISGESMARNRIHLMDELRGFALLCMVFYHAFFTMFMLFDMPLGRTLVDFFRPVEPAFAALFIGVSGVSSRLSKSNLKRGLKLLCVALLLTAATVVFDRFFNAGTTIVFGVLHMLALSILIFHFSKRLLDFIPPLAGICLFSFLFLLTFNISSGYLGFGEFKIALPQAWYGSNALFALGFINNSFYSADYFALFPWLFIFIAGTYLGVWAQQGRFPAWTYRSRVPFFQWMGRRSLAIYVLHQPVIYGVLLVFSLLF